MISNNPAVLFIDDLKFQLQWQQLTREFSRHRLSGFFTQTHVHNRVRWKAETARLTGYNQ